MKFGFTKIDCENLISLITKDLIDYAKFYNKYKNLTLS